MNQVLRKSVVMAALMVAALPGTLLAQKEGKEKEAKEKSKDGAQTIVITRTGSSDEKIVVEVDGDKVKVNGKDVKDNKDVNVQVHTMNGRNVYRSFSPGAGGWSMNMDGGQFSIFSDDENRAMLGVTTENDEKGAAIQSVTEESAASKAGLKKGDIITRIDDQKVSSADDVTKAIRSHKPGDKVAVTYLRDGKEMKTTADLGKWKGIRMNAGAFPRINEFERFEDMEAQGFRMPNPPVPMRGQVYTTMGRPRLGLSIQDTEEGKGVKVLEVDEESNAAKAGLLKDDVILSVDEKEIKSTDDLSRIMREGREKSSFDFKVQRGGKTQTIQVKFPKRLKTQDL